MPTMPMKQYALAYGNPTEGLSLYGPFESHDEAIAYASQDDDGPWWIADLYAPKPIGLEKAN
jgi:hypothetical protein